MKKASKRYYTFDTLRRSSPVGGGKRFLTFLIDLLVQVGLTAAIFLPTFSLLAKLPGYQAAENTINNEVRYYNKEYIAPTKLVLFEDAECTERSNQNKMTYIFVCRSICLSYEVFGDESEPGFVLNDEVKEYGTLSETNESINYFYTSYLTEDAHKSFFDFGGYTPKEYVYALYSNSYGNANAYFDMSDKSGKLDRPDIPIMKNSIAHELMDYMFEGTMENSTRYQAIINGYADMLNNSESVMLKAEPYYSTHYVNYRSSSIKISSYMNGYLLLCCFFTGILTFGISRVIFGNMQTVGKKLLKCGSVDLSDKPVAWYKQLGLISIDVILSVWMALIMYFMPPFTGDFTTFSIPFVENTAFSIGTIVIVLIVLLVINSCGTLFTHNRQSLSELFFMVVQNDQKHVNEDDYDSVNEATPL